MFDDFERSQSAGQPVELYEFATGGDFARFTSSAADVTFESVSYAAIPIGREGFGQQTGERQDTLVVTMPADEPFAQDFVFIPPGATTTLTIRRFHAADPDLEARTIFVGAVKTVVFSRDGHEAQFQVLPVTSAFTRPIPRMTYSGLCNHLLYDARCKIDEHDPDFEKFLPISAVSATGDVITADGAGAFGADFFEAGFVAFSGDYRQVIKQTGDVLQLLMPFRSSPLGQTLRCMAGCKLRHLQDCKDKFDNVVNFGGFPWVPRKNPFQSGMD